MNNLADVYKGEGRLADAERLHSRALEIKQRVLGPKNPETLVSMYNMACVHALQGHRAVALGWLRRVVDGGFLDLNGIAQDPDFKSLHGPEFDAILEVARRNSGAARASHGTPS
jgi:hypothetical protein